MALTPQPFFIGLTIGAVASLVGALLSYRYGLRLQQKQTNAPLRYLLLITIGLSLFGAAALVAALLYGYSVGLVFTTGAGVIIGFWLIFFVLVAFWIRRW